MGRLLRPRNCDGSGCNGGRWGDGVQSVDERQGRNELDGKNTTVFVVVVKVTVMDVVDDDEIVVVVA